LSNGWKDRQLHLVGFEKNEREKVMPETNVYTAGFLCQMFQLSPKEIESELDQAGFKPAFCINNLAHWPADVIPHLRRVSRRLALGSKGDE
jgi:hypothetical protein